MPLKRKHPLTILSVISGEPSEASWCRKNPRGVQYLVCVDYDITYVKALLRKNLLKSIVTVCFFLLLTIPIIKAYTTSYRDFLENLKESEERYRRLAENSPDMIYRMSLPDGKYEYVSPASKTIFGYPPKAWYENPRLIQDIIHPDWLNYFEIEWSKLQKGQLTPALEYQIVTEIKPFAGFISAA